MNIIDQTKNKNIVFVLDDNLIQKEMKDRGVYEIFHHNAAQTDENLVVMRSNYKDAVHFYSLHRHHDDPEDNGYSLIVVPLRDDDPDCQDRVDKVAESVMGSFDDPAAAQEVYREYTIYKQETYCCGKARTN
jgi:hypothetical protein